MNIQGYESIDDVVKKGTNPLSVDDFEKAMEENGAIVLDTRNAQMFAKGFIPDSYNIGIDGSFANWVGTTIINTKQAILIVAEKKREEEVATRLARIGFDNTLGYLEGGFDIWKNAGKGIETISSITAEDLADILEEETVNILDVRRVSEYNTEHVLNAINAPLDYIKDSIKKVDKNKTYYVHCRSGYRSMVFVSILKSMGFKNLIDVKGGMNTIKSSERFKISEYAVPTTML